MTELVNALAQWPTLVMAILVFGFLPGALLRVIVRAFPASDPRRQELIAELYAVPRWERPFWVAQQLEVAIFEGLGTRLTNAYVAAMRTSIGWVFRSELIQRDVLEALDEVPLRHQASWVFGESRDAMSVKWHLESGVEMNRKHPDTFWIPEAVDKYAVRPGHVVKLMFTTSDGWGERMWVRVQRVRRGRYHGMLCNTPIGIPRLGSGSRIKFSSEHIIDIDCTDANEGVEVDSV